MQDCTKPCYYDPSVGEFDYCSPACRDRHLLSSEREHLRNDIKTFEDKVKQSGAGLSTLADKHGHTSAHGSALVQPYRAALSSGNSTQSLHRLKKHAIDL